MTTSSADPLPHASHVRKARRASTMACGHAVNVGHVIVKRQGKWICADCALQAIKAGTEGKRP